MRKSQRQDSLEQNQHAKDLTLRVNNLMLDFDRVKEVTQFRKQEIASNQADALQAMQTRIDQHERLTRKSMADVESQYS